MSRVHSRTLQGRRSPTWTGFGTLKVNEDELVLASPAWRLLASTTVALASSGFCRSRLQSGPMLVEGAETYRMSSDILICQGIYTWLNVFSNLRRCKYKTLAKRRAHCGPDQIQKKVSTLSGRGCLLMDSSLPKT